MHHAIKSAAATLPPERFEWCINAPAVDGAGNVYVESEDSNIYVLDQGRSCVFTTPTLKAGAPASWQCPRCGTTMLIGPNLPPRQLAFRYKYFDSS